MLHSFETFVASFVQDIQCRRWHIEPFYVAILSFIFKSFLFGLLCALFLYMCAYGIHVLFKYSRMAPLSYSLGVIDMLKAVAGLDEPEVQSYPMAFG